MCPLVIPHLPTTIAPTLAPQTPHLMAPRQRSAVEFRLEKKRLLQRAITRSKKRISKAGA
jgi:hypothetical protein